ncbi:MAG: methylenetetrahydrofolate reductase C-terminal domain-containing protein [Desulfobacterales bacterium]|nr:methylenetetrahydrofolate reductase C-terminal domain-containing protein [Desulfobacterales bacterium]
MNGPCGGTNKGKCEVGDEVDCGWFLIVERMKQIGQLGETRGSPAAEELVDVIPWRSPEDIARATFGPLKNRKNKRKHRKEPKEREEGQ